MLHKLTKKHYIKYAIAALLVILFFVIVRNDTEYGVHSTDTFELTCKQNLGLYITFNGKKYSHSKKYLTNECSNRIISTGQLSFKYQKNNHMLIYVTLDDDVILNETSTFSSMVAAIIWGTAFVVMLLLGVDVASIKRKEQILADKKELEELIALREAKEAAEREQ